MPKRVVGNKSKTLDPKKIAMTVHLGKEVHNTKRKFRAEKAVKVIVERGQRLMSTEIVKIDPELNSRIWYRGKNAPPNRVRVIFERTVDGDTPITIAHHEDVESFRGLKTEEVVTQ